MKGRIARPLAAAVIIIAVGLFGCVFLAWVGIDALEGRSDFQFFADSPTYHEAARGDLLFLDTAADLIGIAGNFLGPVLLLRMTGDNYYAILVLNALMLFASVNSLSSSLRIDPVRLLGWLFLNPLTLSSLLSVNKEILSVVFLALMVRAWSRGSLLSYLLAILVSALVRWQLTIVMLVVTLMLTGVNPLKGRRGWSVTVLLLALSALYVAAAPLLEPIRLNFTEAAAEYEGSGFYERLVAFQEAGAYWAIFPIKAAHLLFGMGLRLDRLIAPSNIYNDVWQLLHSTSLLIAFVALWRMRRASLANDLIYISVIYVAVFAITPIYTPRYFYPVYVLWALALSQPRSATGRLGSTLAHSVTPRKVNSNPSPAQPPQR